jgi:hypothetical protein
VLTFDAPGLLDELRQVEPVWPALLNRFMYLQMQQTKPSATRWGDKTPKNLGRLANLIDSFPNAKILYVYRDPRHTVASLSNREFPHASDDELINAEVVRHFNRIYKQQKTQVPPANLLEVRYEELVGEPRKEIQKICKFLDVDFTEQMLGDADADVRKAIGWRDYKGWQEIKPQPSAKRTALTPAAIARLEPLLEEWGYPYKPATIKTRLRAAARAAPFRCTSAVLNRFWRAKHPDGGELFLKAMPEISDYIRWALPTSRSSKVRGVSTSDDN